MNPFNTTQSPTEDGLALIILTCTDEMLGSNLIRVSTIVTEVFRGFPQSLEANIGTVFHLGHDLKSFPAHQSSYLPKTYGRGSVVKMIRYGVLKTTSLSQDTDRTENERNLRIHRQQVDLISLIVFFLSKYGK
jgi:hypothetical protein